MDPDEWERLSYAGDQDHISWLMRLILHFVDERHIIRHALHLVQYELLSFFLFLLCYSVCNPFVITDRVAGQEEKKGKQFVLDQMRRMASNTAFIGKMQYEPHEPGDVILITGVGEAFPFIRVHALLDAMQPYFSDVPVLVMYPGTFDGRYVKLFDKLTPNPYYRAFNVI